MRIRKESGDTDGKDVGLWANAIWSEMNEAENELKRCRNGTKINGGGKNELLIPLPSGIIDVILRTK